MATVNKIPNKMGPHDIGGEKSGPIDVIDHGMKHWEKHANALRMTATGKNLGTLDEMRRAAEDLGERYFELGYFERLTEALAVVLEEKGLITSKMLSRQIKEVEKKFNVPIISISEVHTHDDKPIQEDEKGEGPNFHQLMNLAIQELLEKENLVTADEIRQKIEIFDGDYPKRGPKVVARAWMDSKFKTALLRDANPVIEEMGIDLEHAARIIVVENTPQIHNIIVCTLCSCYPRVLMGQPPTWYKSRSYRSRVVYEPRAVLNEFGTNLSGDITIRTHDSNADMRYMVLPMRPKETKGWTEQQLESIVSRDSLVGVTIPDPNIKTPIRINEP